MNGSPKETREPIAKQTASDAFLSLLRPMKILFVPFGTQGDVEPLFWMADVLAARGHEPVFLITPHYSWLAEERGFKWYPMGTEEEFMAHMKNPLVWDRIKGPQIVVAEMGNLLERYASAMDEIQESFEIIVTSTLAVGPRTVAESRGIPSIAVHLQPVLFRSLIDTPVFLAELKWLSRAPRWVKRLVFYASDVQVWKKGKLRLNPFRKSLGLAPVKNFYDDAVNGGDGLAALFPEWFAPKQADWPDRTKLFGFPLSQVESRPLPQELESFLNAGDPPVLWTHGSANLEVRRFQKAALETCSKLGLRCLLVSLTKPSMELPDYAFHVNRVRFEDVFPRCRAIVHHGGIGTLARAIQAGIPQLIVPQSHDQPDNAVRVEKLGLGRAVPYGKIAKPILTETLNEVLESDPIRKNCINFRERACDELAVERLTD